jgi:type IV secretion system protein VirD4
MTVTRALAWLADPAVAAATSPGPGEGFDVAEFVAGPNTLYMIGTGREEAPIAPLFRAFAEYVHAGGAYVGSVQPHGRLDPPMLMALDEVTQICPVPLPHWMADSAGKGILIVAVCHGLAQLEARWHSSGARAIWDTAGIKVILGGVGDPDTLDRLSRLCGEIDLRRHTWTRFEDGRRARAVTHQSVRVLPPELLRTLPEWRALVLRGNLSPVVVRLRMAWRRHDYRRAKRAELRRDNRIGVVWQRTTPVAAARLPQPSWPRSAGPGGVDTLVTGYQPGYSAGSKPPPVSPGEAAARRAAPGPQAGPTSRRTPDAPGPRPSGGDLVPRPRRPWDPPADSGDRS